VTANQERADAMAIAEERHSHTLALIDEALVSVEKSCASRYREELKHPVQQPRLHGLTRALNSVAEHVGLHVARMSYVEATEAFRHDFFSQWTSTGTLLSALKNPVEFDNVYDLLADEASRRIYDWYISCRVAYAIVGEAAFSLFPPSESHSDYERRCQSLGPTTHGSYRVSTWTVDCLRTILVDTFLLEQYRLADVVEPEHGETALDVGAYKGETALWLAEAVGPSGKVFAFEPIAANRVALQSNVQRNMAPSMASIHVMACGVGATTGIQSFFGTAGGSSTIDAAGETQIQVTTIDDAVQSERMERVDFIKMDIEGGEVDALTGAQATLRDLAPKLAICVYHKPHDLPDIVNVIHQARPDYQIYLQHKSPELRETVLFASVVPSNRGL